MICPSHLHQKMLVMEIDNAPEYGDSPSPVDVPDLSSPSPLVVDDATLRNNHLLTDEEREKLKRDRFRSVLSKLQSTLYRVVHLYFTPDTEVLDMLFDKCQTKNRKTSLKQHIKYSISVAKFS